MHNTTDVASLPLQQNPATTTVRDDRSASWSILRLDRPRPRWMLTQFATAVLLALTLVGSLVALAPTWPGRQEADPAFLAAPSGILATPASATGPIVAFLWEADGGPNAPLILPAGEAVDPQGNV